MVRLAVLLKAQRAVVDISFLDFYYGIIAIITKLTIPIIPTLITGSNNPKPHLLATF